MTDASGNIKINLALGIQSDLGKVDYSPHAIGSCFRALLNPSSQIGFPVAFKSDEFLMNLCLT